MKRPRRDKMALILQQGSEIVQAQRRQGMLGSEHLLANCQRPLKEGPGLGMEAAAEEVTASPVQKVGSFLSFGSARRVRSI